jgi:hypothetical protein
MCDVVIRGRPELDKFFDDDMNRCPRCAYARDCSKCGVGMVCRRFPPAAAETAQTKDEWPVCAKWPHVGDDDWCGEFVPRDRDNG